MRLLAAALLFSACTPRPAEFPVGFFGVETPEDARLLAGEGFDAVQSYRTDPASVAALAKAARANGQLFLVSPVEVMTGTSAPAGLRGTIWYLQDEPDVNGVSAAELRERDAKVKAWDPGATTAFVVGDGRTAKDYPGAGDAIMVDWYPVPHLPLESAGDHVRMTAEAAGGRKVWAVLQAMDWREFPQRDPKKPRIGRFPTMAEIRFMSYDAVLNGAQGVWYFVYTVAPGRNLSQTPELLFAASEPARELRAMAPIFARGKPIPLPWEPGDTPATARAWRYHGRDYVVIESRGGFVQIPQGLVDGSWRPLFETRRDPKDFLPKVDGKYGLEPHQVLVLESRLRWKALVGL
ncbi:MAG: hypothetical protein HY079_08345 [Elusimicrobia bacterium]|nr:hypothetical protein [Elusimicrobiota bacterium]